MRDSRIGFHMVKHPHSITPDVSITAAMDLMRSLNIRHLPVLEREKLVGLVSDRDLRGALALDKANQLRIGDVMKRDVFVTTPDTSLSDVAQEMALQKFGSALIVDRRGHITGIFTTTDALRILADLADEGKMDEYLVDFEEYCDAVPTHATW